MSHGALLLPNLGGEEGRDWRTRRQEPGALAALRAWRLLFAADARIVGETSETSRNNADWPEDLGPPAAQPVFDWLENAGAVVPWYACARDLADPALAGHPVEAPDPEVVRRGHDKAIAQRFALREGFVPRPLRPLIEVFEPKDLEAEQAIDHIDRALSAWPTWTGGRFTLKPRFGCNGRGRVGGTGRAAELPSLPGSLPRLAARGGAILEPWLDRTLDLAAEMFLDASGELRMLGTLEQVTSRSGVYRGHRGEVDSAGRVSSGSTWDEALREAAAAIGCAARDEGFRGPCGIDAFAFRAEEREIFRPIVELNARFTLGTVALGLVRRALPRIKAPLDLVPGRRCAFYFALDAPNAVADPRVHQIRLGQPGASPNPALLFARSRQELDTVLEGG